MNKRSHDNGEVLDKTSANDLAHSGPRTDHIGHLMRERGEGGRERKRGLRERGMRGRGRVGEGGKGRGEERGRERGDEGEREGGRGRERGKREGGRERGKEEMTYKR